jgi:hypothetical protein
MKYFYDGQSGMVPNIGEFKNGDEVPADVAQKLQAAGYAVRQESESEPAKYSEGDQS